jgi:predicted DsbA family dithiol-disulfide isomerase
MPDQGMDRREYCIRKFGSWERCEEMFVQIAAVGQTVGLEFHFEKQTTIPNTFIAHRVIWLAGQEGIQDSVVEALFRAYFCDGVDLSIQSQLVEVCDAAGLDPARLERFLSSEEGAAEVQGEEQEVKSLGISAVPLFIIHDRVAVSGAQPPETLLQAFEQAQQFRRKGRSSAGESVKPRHDPQGCKV